jgi:transcriptional regulator with XRE-family HTH domain
MPDAADLVKAARARSGISQRRLALRAGTSQDAISRIERGVESPGVERLRRLLLAMGEDLKLVAEPDSTGQPGGARMSPAELLAESASWNRAATQLEIAGATARAAGHPATQRDRALK